ncbi:glycosylated lysosomal membrane protein [Mixophyes fleayi]|uniref:glycosylated lysosomal membrane protein n=1 Tax=Mixophyes fleayi TaxID=3061075 RepID=UPI003F4DFF7B
MRLGLWLVVGALCAGARGATGTEEGQEETRQVSMQYNPGSSSSSVNLLHIRAVGKGNTIHYLWSTIGTPTVLLIYTETEQSQLLVNWTKLLSPEPYGAIAVHPPESVRYSTALLFTRIFEYNDVNNTGNFSGTAERYFYPPYELSDFVWENANETLNSSALTAHLTGVNASDPDGNFQNGSVAFKVSAYRGPGRDISSPRLLHTANCTKLEFTISGVRPRGNNSRFALEMVTLEKKAGRKTMRSVRTIDDEYTPTIFESVELVPDLSNNSRAKGFFQWKSVAYGSAIGARSDALPCQMYKPLAVNGTLGLRSIVHAFYGEDLSSGYNLEVYNMSFGIADGDFYDKNKFLGWSALIGYGTPPRDSFSVLVICIMAVALGTPLVLLMVGAIVVSVMKKRVFSNYRPIN